MSKVVETLARSAGLADIYAKVMDGERLSFTDGARMYESRELMAIGAMDAIRARGLRVPEDISVVGYDDISLAAHSNPPLTTVRQNIPESGKLLVQNLVQFLETGFGQVNLAAHLES